jgi:hypothetical protein
MSKFTGIFVFLVAHAFAVLFVIDVLMEHVEWVPTIAGVVIALAIVAKLVEVKSRNL